MLFLIALCIALIGWNCFVRLFFYMVHKRILWFYFLSIIFFSRIGWWWPIFLPFSRLIRTSIVWWSDTRKELPDYLLLATRRKILLQTFFSFGLCYFLNGSVAWVEARKFVAFPNYTISDCEIRNLATITPQELN